MSKRHFKFGAALALLAAGNAQAAETCITPREVRGLVGYALPTVLQHLSDTCGPSLAADGHMRTGVHGLIGALSAERESYWPAAKSAFAKFGDQKEETAAILAELPDDVLRPLVDELFVREFKFVVEPDKCRDVEDVLEALEPLPPENAVRLVSVLLEITARKDRKMPSCPRQP